jgi:hypothetical protein
MLLLLAFPWYLLARGLGLLCSLENKMAAYKYT